MTENKPIINIIFDSLNHRIKNIGEKCLNFQKQNKNLKEQLARKTQECEEALKQLEFVRTHNTVLCSEIDQLKSENEELKNIINEAKNSGLDLKSFLLSEAIQEEHEEKIDKLKANKEQAEQKLERIRDIVDTIYKYANRLDENNWGIIDCKIIEQTKQITQVIDEVE